MTTRIDGGAINVTNFTSTGTVTQSGTLKLGGATISTFPAGTVIQIHTMRRGSDLSTTSDADVATGLTTSFVPIQGSSARLICMCQGGAQRTDDSSTRGATSLYINTNDGNGSTFYGYTGCYAPGETNDYLEPHSAYFETGITDYPDDGSAIEVQLRMREQGGSTTYHFHDSVGGLSSVVFFTVMEVVSSGNVNAG